ncbi:hypothetical protein DB346_23635 [Verrucomicrobia bacterium LW23]|nr:hypothetical protein DB346_23635 [Verrucomicrobia bacterium LW23]
MLGQKAFHVKIVRAAHQRRELIVGAQIVVPGTAQVVAAIGGQVVVEQAIESGRLAGGWQNRDVREVGKRTAFLARRMGTAIAAIRMSI